MFSYPSVQEDVDLNDFLCIEAIRIFQPLLYEIISGNWIWLTGKDDKISNWRSQHGDRTPKATPLDPFLEKMSTNDSVRARELLGELFPRFAATIGAIHASSASPDKLARSRRIGSPRHAQTYFVLSLAGSTLSSKEVETFLAATNEDGGLGSRFAALTERIDEDGSSFARHMLEELVTRAEELSPAKTLSLFKAMASSACALDRPNDAQPWMDNYDLIYVLLSRSAKRHNLDVASYFAKDNVTPSSLPLFLQIAYSIAYDERFIEVSPRSMHVSPGVTTKKSWSMLVDELMYNLCNFQSKCEPNVVQRLPLLAKIVDVKDHARIRDWTEAQLATHDGLLCVATNLTTGRINGVRYIVRSAVESWLSLETMIEKLRELASTCDKTSEVLRALNAALAQGDERVRLFGPI
jgi:hypothetical protein